MTIGDIEGLRKVLWEVIKKLPRAAFLFLHHFPNKQYIQNNYWRNKNNNN